MSVPTRPTHHCAALDVEHAGSSVVLMGWVERIRDLGGLLFLDLRDYRGVTQIVVRPGSGPAAAAKRLGTWWVVAVEGLVLTRDAQTVNPTIDTGRVEVEAERIHILSEARTPPFAPTDSEGVAEELRLRYRYLDLRNPRLQRNLRIRGRLATEIRGHLDGHGFLEVETPFLTRSTPEGARDYLVPSRVHRGCFYALPQSPQLFKQLLMIGGTDRYYQIVRCFRDEDLRADRQPEFTQVDVEMSFADPDQVIEVTEGLFQRALGAVGIEVEPPFPRFTYRQAMDRYGVDRPDLRYGAEIRDVTELARGTGHPLLDRVVGAGGSVRGIAAPGCAGFSRKRLDGLQAAAVEAGAGGLLWAAFSGGEVRSPLLKTLGADRLRALLEAAGGGPSDLLLMVAGEAETACRALGALRRQLAASERWTSPEQFAMAWVTEFPLFERSEGEGRLTSVHHPFTSPHPDDVDRLATDPLSVRSLAYDVIANGFELGGGSIRIHDRAMQQRVFDALAIPPAEAAERFGFFLEALDYGTPPHGGIALGFDRIAMLASGSASLRDVIAFPKTTSATDLMTGSPAGVDPSQLDEVGVALANQAGDQDD
ncbi:MAG: aspartate--tRNA ligase [Acidobacteria bacterium]|nr:aspartate--tRNA ligase [Acidobacteriota bacterium]MYB31887.1 aspartate--tRNA ligase [Acidobacteriota bacterium]MYH22732.1 aspartate--tRNA ligase [Acidobacteriota bacterium]